MNKLRGKFLLIIIICTIVFLPKSAYAVVTKASARKTCRDKIGITIDPGTYQRSAGYRSGKYWNSVEKREVKITVKNSDTYKYRLIIFEGPYGSLENADDLTKEEIKNSGARVKNEILKDDDYFYELDPGKEIIVIVLQDQNYELINKNNKKVKCEAGDIVRVNSTAYDIELTGTAASAFIQNPGAESGTILTNYKNREHKGEKCSNAYEGIHSSNPQFSVKNESQAVKDTWISDYYSRILHYCEDKEVPFNLDDDEIEKVSDALLEMYYRIRNGSTGTSVAAVTASMNALKNQVDDYYIYNSTDSSKTEGKTANSVNVRDQKLYCEYDSANMEYDTVNHTGKYKAGSGQKSYLYAETSSQSAKLVGWNEDTDQVEKLDTVKVCDSTCYEHLTVVYSPPQTVKAGLCFQYRVTVKSKVECGVDYNTEQILNKLNDVLNKRDMCSAMPACEDNKQKTQAGPSQDFDNCVNSCDNGQYSQKCINKCYDKVYKDKYDTSKTASTKKTQNTITTPVIYDNSNSSIVKLTVKAKKDLVEKNYENYYKNYLEEVFSDIIKNYDLENEVKRICNKYM